MGIRTLYKSVRKLFLPSVEKRSYNTLNLHELLDSIGYGVGGDETTTSISTLSAMRISTFFTCVLVRAESLASLPAHVMQFTSTGSNKAYNHPAHYLIHDRPNPFQTASDFWKTVSAHIDTEGESIGIITWSGRWMPQQINLIPNPKEVDVVVSGGRPWYRYQGVLYEDW